MAKTRLDEEPPATSQQKLNHPEDSPNSMQTVGGARKRKREGHCRGPVADKKLYIPNQE
jgi:hypothetical protein